MVTTSIEIQFPSGFDPDHECVVIDCLAGRLSGWEAWARAFEAFDLLDQECRLVSREMSSSYLLCSYYYTLISGAELSHSY